MTVAPLSICVVGAGLMGHGIALVMARAGHTVTVADPVPAALAALPGRLRASLAALDVGEEEAAAILDRVTAVETLEDAVSPASIVFEAAPEKLELKQSIFARVEAATSSDTILASNTSVIPITLIMGNLGHRGRALGTHWWNPPHMIPLVEVIRTEWTDGAVMDAMITLLDDAGKVTVRVEKDVPGFIGNRLQNAMWREAISLVERGICDAEAVDMVVKASFGRRLAVLGPLENADLIGTDLTLDIHEQVLADLESRPGPSPLLRQMVAEGRLGMKSGQGFRTWTPEQAESLRARLGRYLGGVAALLARMD